MSDCSKSRAVISGAGTVGVIAAIVLTQQGWTVQVFEKLDKPSPRPAKGDQRTYSLSLTTRGISAFKLAGVGLGSLVAAQGGRVGLKFFKKNGKPLRSESVAVTADPVHIRALREEVTWHVINEAQRLHPEINFHFNAQIQKVDLAQQCVHVPLAGSTDLVQVPYDLLVGADGAGSVVRSALQQILPSTFLRRYRHNSMYTSAPIPNTYTEDSSTHTMLEAHTLLKEGTVARDVRGDDRNQVGLILPQPQADAIRDGSADAFLSYFAKSAPNLPENARQAVVQMVQSCPQFYPIPSWTHLSQLHGPRTVLLGDAAHTMTPALGQGLNCGLEDVVVFAQCLKDFDGDLDAALPAYTKARLPDIQAIMTINEVVATSDVGLATQCAGPYLHALKHVAESMAVIEMVMLVHVTIASQDQDLPHQLWIRGHGLLLIVHMILHTLLHKVAPTIFDEPLLMPMAMGTKVMPYRAIIAALYRDGILLSGVLLFVVYALCS